MQAVRDTVLRLEKVLRVHSQVDLANKIRASYLIEHPIA